jgi:hypothetical protein
MDHVRTKSLAACTGTIYGVPLLSCLTVSYLEHLS